MSFAIISIAMLLTTQTYSHLAPLEDRFVWACV